MIHNPDKITYHQWMEYRLLAVQALAPGMGSTLANEVVDILTTVPCPDKPEAGKRFRG